MRAEKTYIEKLIKQAQIAKARAERKPNVPLSELSHIENNLTVLKSILSVLQQAEGRNEK